MQSRNGGSKEGNFSLVAKTIKGKKFFHQKNKDKKPQDKHIDLSKIRCLNCQRWDIMLEIVTSKRESSRENFMHLLLQKKNLRKRKLVDLPMIKNEGESTIWFQHSVVPLPIVLSLGWWTMELLDI